MIVSSGNPPQTETTSIETVQNTIDASLSFQYALSRRWALTLNYNYTVVWGEPGTNGQHAFYQLIHQGTRLVPVDFIASVAPGDQLDPAHHRILLMNCFAQGAALMAGKQSDDPARCYPGNRPSATILCDDLDPATLGALIAFHEHRTFANAVLMGINPFDQFGVELGKEIANKIERGGESFDPSTQALLRAAGLAE